MKWLNRKSRVVTKLLTFLGFSSATFVLTACYGTIPKYGDQAAADLESLQMAIEQNDSVDVSEVPVDVSEVPVENPQNSIDYED